MNTTQTKYRDQARGAGLGVSLKYGIYISYERYAIGTHICTKCLEYVWMYISTNDTLFIGTHMHEMPMIIGHGSDEYVLFATVVEHASV